MKKILSITVLALASLHLIYVIDAWSQLNELTNRFSSISIFLENSRKELIFKTLINLIFLFASIGGLISSINDEKELKNIQKKETEREWERKRSSDYAPIQIINPIKINKDENIYKGERNISEDSYKLYLVNKYKVTKNEVFNKFVFNEKLYESIDEVLITLHELDMSNANSKSQNISANSSNNYQHSSNTSDEYGITVVKSKLSQLGYLIEESQNSSGNRKFTLTKRGTTEYLYSTDELIKFFNERAV
jgi:hypothetical protein